MNTMNMNLKTSELERLAYLAGNPLCNMYAAQDEINDLELRHEDEIKAAQEEAYAEGKAAGMGIDTAKEIERLEAEVTRIKSDFRRLYENMTAIGPWLNGPEAKNAKGRKAYHAKLRYFLMETPRY